MESTSPAATFPPLKLLRALSAPIATFTTPHEAGTPNIAGFLGLGVAVDHSNRWVWNTWKRA